MSERSATLGRRTAASTVEGLNLTSIAELFREHARGLVQRAQRVLGSQADAEDAVQEVMLSLLEAPDVLASVDRLAGFLYTLVRRRAIDILRSEIRRRRREGSDVVAQLLEQAADQGTALEQEELAAALAAAIQELPEPQREAFTANAIDGVSFRELSARTGVPMGTLMARKKRAVDHIRNRLCRDGLLPARPQRASKGEAR